MKIVSNPLLWSFEIPAYVGMVIEFNLKAIAGASVDFLFTVNWDARISPFASFGAMFGLNGETWSVFWKYVFVTNPFTLSLPKKSTPWPSCGVGFGGVFGNLGGVKGVSGRTLRWGVTFISVFWAASIAATTLSGVTLTDAGTLVFVVIVPAPRPDISLFPPVDSLDKSAVSSNNGIIFPILIY